MGERDGVEGRSGCQLDLRRQAGGRAGATLVGVDGAERAGGAGADLGRVRGPRMRLSEGLRHEVCTGGSEAGRQPRIAPGEGREGKRERKEGRDWLTVKQVAVARHEELEQEVSHAAGLFDQHDQLIGRHPGDGGAGVSEAEHDEHGRAEGDEAGARGLVALVTSQLLARRVGGRRVSELVPQEAGEVLELADLAAVERLAVARHAVERLEHLDIDGDGRGRPLPLSGSPSRAVRRDIPTHLTSRAVGDRLEAPPLGSLLSLPPLSLAGLAGGGGDGMKCDELGSVTWSSRTGHYWQLARRATPPPNVPFA